MLQFGIDLGIGTQSLWKSEFPLSLCQDNWPIAWLSVELPVPLLVRKVFPVSMRQIQTVMEESCKLNEENCDLQSHQQVQLKLLSRLQRIAQQS